MPALSVVPSGGGGPPGASPTSGGGGFQFKNWWRNGIACRLCVLCSLLMLFNLFEPWTPDYEGAGYTETSYRADRVETRYFSGTSAKGTGNAMTESAGWLFLAGIAATLFVCGRSRTSVGGQRWIPLCTAIIIFATTVDDFRAAAKKREQWLARFTTRPLVMESAAFRWVIIFSFCMIFSGAAFARRKVDRSPQPPPAPAP